MAVIDKREQTGDPRHEIAEIERILGSEEIVEPSPAFSRQVMASIHREAALPAPIPFPWRRLLPGVAICGALLAVAAVAILRAPIAPFLPALPATGPALGPTVVALASTAAILAATWLLTWFARHLVQT